MSSSRAEAGRSDAVAAAPREAVEYIPTGTGVPNAGDSRPAEFGVWSVGAPLGGVRLGVGVLWWMSSDGDPLLNRAGERLRGEARPDAT